MVARYVERNALRAKLVRGDRAEVWSWSSLWLRDRRDRGRLTEVEARLAASCAAWPVPPPRDWLRRVNRAETASELEALRKSVVRGCPFGSARWSARVVTRLGLESTIRQRGRPRKGQKSS